MPCRLFCVVCAATTSSRARVVRNGKVDGVPFPPQLFLHADVRSKAAIDRFGKEVLLLYLFTVIKKIKRHNYILIICFQCVCVAGLSRMLSKHQE